MKTLKRYFPVFLVCVVIPLVLVGSIIQRQSRFSPIDEGAHYDYVQRLPGSGIPVMGDTMLQSSLDFISCRGVDLPGLVLPSCNSPEVRPEGFPGGGLNYEAQQPPLYYLSAAPVAWVLSNWLGLGELGASRTVGVFWLIAALIVIYLTGQTLRVNRGIMLGAMFAVTASPVVAYHTAIVSNDAAVLFFAALIAYIAALTHTNQRSYVWWGFGAALIAGFVKTTIVTAVFAAALLLLVAVLPEIRSNLRTFWKSSQWKIYGNTAIGMIAGGLLAAISWNLYSRYSATLPLKTFPTYDVLRNAEVGVVSIMREALVSFGPLTDSFTPFGAWNGDVTQILSMFTKVAIIGIGTAGLFGSSRVWWRAAGPIVLFGTYAGTVALGLGIWKTYNMTPGLVSRYGILMLPTLILVLAAGIQGPVAKRVATGVSVATGLLFSWIIFQTPLI
jgi:hypothetical protein